MGKFTLDALKSWKTTFLGFALIIGTVAKWVQAGHVDYNDIGLIVAGLTGVVAKDANVTGA